MRPVISPGAPRTADERSAPSVPARRSRGGHGRASEGVRVRHLDRAADDGYRSPLVPGLRATADAERLADELAFAMHRLHRLSGDPPGLYAEVAGAADLEERAWLAFLIAYVGPLDGEDPFATIRAVRTTWASGELPLLDGAVTGPRTTHDPARGDSTIAAYRAWAGRTGSQREALTGEHSWTPERRFARVFERLALPGLSRDARFDLLVTLGRLGVFELRASMLALGGSDDVTLAAKRAFGIGDALLLERRAAALAEACELPLDALDVALYNWQRGERATLGLGADDERDPAALSSAGKALGL